MAASSHWPLLRVHVYEPIRAQWNQIDMSTAQPLRCCIATQDRRSLVISQGANTVVIYRRVL
jgi:hypothetical protein